MRLIEEWERDNWNCVRSVHFACGLALVHSERAQHLVEWTRAKPG